MPVLKAGRSRTSEHLAAACLRRVEPSPRGVERVERRALSNSSVWAADVLIAIRSELDFQVIDELSGGLFRVPGGEQEQENAAHKIVIFSSGRCYRR